MIILASASPRRAELLKCQGVDFEAIPSSVDESILPGEVPQSYVLRVAEEKAAYQASRLKTDAKKYDLVLAADTSVICDDRILGKPENLDDFLFMMKLLSGNTHRVLTAVAVEDCTLTESSALSYRESFVVETAVSFRELSESEIQSYWDSGEPQDKAGGYGIQGLGACFIIRIEGSYTNVVGLPISETMQLLRKRNILGYLG